MTDISQQPPPSSDPTAGNIPNPTEERTGDTPSPTPEPETERGGSPAPHSTSRTNEEERDPGNS